MVVLAQFGNRPAGYDGAASPPSMRRKPAVNAPQLVPAGKER
jgi:hypothetical protein